MIQKFTLDNYKLIGEYSQINKKIYKMCISHTIRLDTLGHLETYQKARDSNQ